MENKKSVSDVRLAQLEEIRAKALSSAAILVASKKSGIASDTDSLIEDTLSITRRFVEYIIHSDD